MLKVLLLTDFSSGYSRNLLKGVVDYAKKHGPWIFYRMPLYYRDRYGDKGVVKWAKEWKADAIIAQLNDVDINSLNELNIPILVQNYTSRNVNVSNITGDYFGTGVMAAEYFIRRGYKNFAYYGFTDAVWMRERGYGFRAGVERAGYKVDFFNEKDLTIGEKGKWHIDDMKVVEWLNTLPKPIALFACDDFFALQITEICKMHNIGIPRDIALLGVDNDNLLCHISDPLLSSIELDVRRGGYEAGRLIDEVIRKGDPVKPVDIVVRPTRVVTRKSTDSFATTDKYINLVLNYIKEHFMEPLSVDDIVEIVPFSRRVLEKRFKSETGMPVYQYIQFVRVDHFIHLMLTSDITLSNAASLSGFDDYKNISRVFVKLKGMSPSEFRKIHKIQDNDVKRV